VHRLMQRLGYAPISKKNYCFKILPKINLISKQNQETNRVIVLSKHRCDSATTPLSPATQRGACDWGKRSSRPRVSTATDSVATEHQTNPTRVAAVQNKQIFIFPFLLPPAPRPPAANPEEQATLPERTPSRKGLRIEAD
jgi:hypothetical protein